MLEGLSTGPFFMCRIFGYRGVLPTGVRRALVDEENALATQSRLHPDGWGVAWYEAGSPRLFHSLDCAHLSESFHDLCDRVSSDTVVAHVRKASVGPLALCNTHPFAEGPWVFAHNGTIPDFDAVRPALEAALSPARRAGLRGDTDSERVFALFLTHLERLADAAVAELDQACAALAATLSTLFAMTEDSEESPSLNLLVTNGRVLAACRQGRSLFFSTHDFPPPGTRSLARSAASGERVEHLLVASERIGQEHAWTELADGDVVGVDSDMRLRHEPLGGRPTVRPGRAIA
jgi:glutamine amidotransferase